MTTSSFSIPRFRLALAAVFCGVVGLTMLLLAQTAHADPVVVAQATTDAGWALLEQYGPLWGGTLVAYGLLTSLLRRNESSHWIARGRILSSLTGLAMIGEALLAWKVNGAPSAGIAVAIFAAINLVMHSTVSGPVPAGATGKGAGVAAMLAVLLLGAGLAVSQVSCGGTLAVAAETLRQNGATIYLIRNRVWLNPVTTRPGETSLRKPLFGRDSANVFWMAQASWDP